MTMVRKQSKDVATTPNGKVLQRVLDTESNLYKFQFSTGGELPEELQGRWSSPQYLEEVAEAYINKLLKIKENARVRAEHRKLREYQIKVGYKKLNEEIKAWLSKKE